MEQEAYVKAAQNKYILRKKFKGMGWMFADFRNEIFYSGNQNYPWKGGLDAPEKGAIFLTKEEFVICYLTKMYNNTPLLYS